MDAKYETIDSKVIYDETQPHPDPHEIDKKVPNHNKIITSLTAGALAGGIAKTTIAPLDRCKINFQISQQRYSTRAAFRFLANTWRNDGFLNLWRGNSATMVRIVPYASVQYTAHEQWKRVLNTNQSRHLTPGKHFLAGALAGVTSVSVTYPLDLVRARMAVTQKHKYSNLFQVFFKICREERIGTLYRGFTPTVLGSIPYAGIGFSTYETCKKTHHEYFDEPIGAGHRMLYGAFSGICAQTASYPLDIVRRRMQTAGVTHREAEYRSIVSTVRSVFSTDGWRGMYKGLSMNWIKGPIAVGMSFTTFDTVQSSLRRLPIFQE